ncbi:MAG: hypothetical protein HUJ26_16055, partial [Planctomycetaceae bacterium]|nr:hypothetical protein [Planctomycetaceae bacterium]
MNDDAIKIILLPGMDGTGELLECFVERAPQKFEPFVVPLPQKALSSYPELADRVIRHIPINEPFLLLGESFSGPLALEIASRQLTDLMGVILVASFVTPPVSQRLRWLPWSLLFHLPAPRAMIQRLLLNSTEDETLATEVLQTLRSVDPQVLASRVQLVLNHNSRQVLKSCPAPLLSLQSSFARLV